MIAYLFYVFIYTIIFIVLFYLGNDIELEYKLIIFTGFICVVTMKYFSKFKYKKNPRTLFEKINNKSYLFEKKYKKYINFIWLIFYVLLFNLVYGYFKSNYF